MPADSQPPIIVLASARAASATLWAETATGTTALREIYDDWSIKAVTPDLAALWTSLGVRSEKPDRVTFDDAAPLASLRRDLTVKLPAPSIAASRP